MRTRPRVQQVSHCGPMSRGPRLIEPNCAAQPACKVHLLHFRHLDEGVYLEERQETLQTSKMHLKIWTSALTISCFKSALSAGFLIKLQRRAVTICDVVPFSTTWWHSVLTCKTESAVSATENVSYLPFIHKVLKFRAEYPRELWWRLNKEVKHYYKAQRYTLRRCHLTVATLTSFTM